jgi:hypothetical protein
MQGERTVREREFSVTDYRKLGKILNGVWFVAFKVYNFQNTCLYCRTIAPFKSRYTPAHFYPTARRNFYRRNIQDFCLAFVFFNSGIFALFLHSHLLYLFLSPSVPPWNYSQFICSLSALSAISLFLTEQLHTGSP